MRKTKKVRKHKRTIRRKLHNKKRQTRKISGGLNHFTHWLRSDKEQKKYLTEKLNNLYILAVKMSKHDDAVGWEMYKRGVNDFFNENSYKSLCSEEECKKPGMNTLCKKIKSLYEYSIRTQNMEGGDQLNMQGEYKIKNGKKVNLKIGDSEPFYKSLHGLKNQTVYLWKDLYEYIKLEKLYTNKLLDSSTPKIDSSTSKINSSTPKINNSTSSKSDYLTDNSETDNSETDNSSDIND